MIVAASSIVVVFLLTAILAAFRSSIDPATDLLAFLLVVFAAANLGGWIIGLLTAAVSVVSVVWYLMPPLHTFRFSDGQDVTAIVTFIAVALATCIVVAIADRRAADAERARDEAAIARAAAAGDELRTAILRAVSHDLRTPLSSIKASATSLLQSDVEWSEAERTEFLETIDDEVDRLDKVVGDLLDLSRLEAGVIRPRRERVEIGPVITHALESLSDSTDGVVVDVLDDLPDLQADPMLLERSLANVVANAMRHAGGRASIVSRRRGAGVEIRVVDHGPGIAPQDRDAMFEPFRRLGDARGDGRAGVGLGLAVARGLLDAMEFGLQFADTPGGGLTVVITGPVWVGAREEVGA